MGGNIMKLNKKSKKGFTLIELLIVVAIIAILAAIAIPQFGQYRVRGYNSAASSDLRNFKIAEESFKSDAGVYASSQVAGLAGTGALLSGPLNVNVPVVANSINTSFPSSPTTLAFGLSNGVSAGINTTATTAADYVALFAHTQGNVVYAADSNNTQLKQAGKDSAGAAVAIGNAAQTTGGQLVIGTVPTSDNADDLPTATWSNL